LWAHIMTWVSMEDKLGRVLRVSFYFKSLISDCSSWNGIRLTQPAHDIFAIARLCPQLLAGMRHLELVFDIYRSESETFNDCYAFLRQLRGIFGRIPSPVPQTVRPNVVISRAPFFSNGVHTVDPSISLSILTNTFSASHRTVSSAGTFVDTHALDVVSVGVDAIVSAPVVVGEGGGVCNKVHVDPRNLVLRCLVLQGAMSDSTVSSVCWWFQGLTTIHLRHVCIVANTSANDAGYLATMLVLPRLTHLYVSNIRNKVPLQSPTLPTVLHLPSNLQCLEIEMDNTSVLQTTSLAKLPPTHTFPSHSSYSIYVLKTLRPSSLRRLHLLSRGILSLHSTFDLAMCPDLESVLLTPETWQFGNTNLVQLARLSRLTKLELYNWYLPRDREPGDDVNNIIPMRPLQVLRLTRCNVNTFFFFFFFFFVYVLPFRSATATFLSIVAAAAFLSIVVAAAFLSVVAAITFLSVVAAAAFSSVVVAATLLSVVRGKVGQGGGDRDARDVCIISVFFPFALNYY
jgi:hypothetical protein